MNFQIEGISKLEYEETLKAAQGEALTVSDGYHTFEELYEHRLALNAALFNYLWGVQKMLERNGYPEGKSWVIKSKLHNDGTMFKGGYFVAAALIDGKQISYHYKLEHWDKFRIPAVNRVPWEYDGHTPQDTIKRLLDA